MRIPKTDHLNLIRYEVKCKNINNYCHCSRVRISTYHSLAMFLYTFTYRLWTDSYDSIFWFGDCALIGILGLVAGMKKWNVQ